MSEPRPEGDVPAAHGTPILFARLEALAVEIMARRTPNAGRFCGDCYNPLSPDDHTCPHCQTVVPTRAPVEQMPREVINMVRAKRRREVLKGAVDHLEEAAEIQIRPGAHEAIARRIREWGSRDSLPEGSPAAEDKEANR